MNQQSFESRYSSLWNDIESTLESKDIDASADFPSRYRQICQHLAIAKHRRYSPNLVEKLNRLVLNSHHHLYGHRTSRERQWIDFFTYGFPTVLRKRAAFVWVSAALFLLPLISMVVLCNVDDEVIYSVIAAENVREFESMYNPAARTLGKQRSSDSDIMMFGYYINNNIGISFQVFATGILFGIGSAFYLLYNGLVIGAVTGHMAHIGYHDTFFPFVIGHGAFELTAIIFSGAAGLMLGYSLIAPGQRSRLSALKLAGQEAVKIIYGSTIMLLIAAFIEAFWSSSTDLQPSVKYTVGAALWVLVIAYILLAGRGRSREP